MNAKDYLVQTEHVVRHLFDGLNYYESVLDGLIPPSQSQDMADIKKYVERARVYFGHSFSEAILCGSILQIAFMGIYKFSDNSEIPSSSRAIVTNKNSPAIRFCIGREIHGLPIGMIIYAARNQYNHWDEENFNQPTTEVFKTLYRAYLNNQFFDMAYDLNYPARTVKANHIVLSELQWRSYADYHKDMNALICNKH